MADELFTQCLLAKANRSRMAFIPSHAAHTGTVVTLISDDDSRDPGWTVHACYGTMTAKQLDGLRNARINLTRIEEGLS